MLLTNLKIITMDDKTIDNGFIHIKEDKINKVGDMQSLKIKDTEVLDLSGCCALPGFIDGHCHLGMWEDSQGFEGDDGNEETDPAAPHLRAIDGIYPLDKGFDEALESGITTVVVGPGSANPIGGQLAAIKNCGRIIDKMIIKQPVGIKFALGENPKSVYHEKNQAPSTRMATAAIIREHLFKAKDYKNAVQNVQEDEDLDKPDFDFKSQSLIPLLNKEIKAYFHAHRCDDIFTAIRIAKEFDLDYVIIHGTDAHLIASELKSENSKILLGPALSNRSKPELKNLTFKTGIELEKQGIDFAIITDHPETPVNCLYLCAMLCIKEGLSKQQAFRAITINPAKICGIDNRVGSISAGKDADIVVFNDDLLNFDSKIKFVISNGKIVKNNT
jgi:imidazolonepropionase-like amidohydrolase